MREQHTYMMPIRLKESYAGMAYRDINEQLWERAILDIDEYGSQYEKHLNELLDNLEPCNKSLVYTWHLSDDILNFLSNNLGKNVEFSAFLSTSLMHRDGNSNLHLYTSSKSNGKRV